MVYFPRNLYFLKFHQYRVNRIENHTFSFYTTKPDPFKGKFMAFFTAYRRRAPVMDIVRTKRSLAAI